MKNPELESLLQKARLPEISAESLEMFPRHVANRLQSATSSPRPAWRFSLLSAWGLGFAAAAVALVFSLGKFQSPPATETAAVAGDLLASAKFAGETLSMFPHQVRTIIEDAQGVHLVLSDQNETPSSPPLYIHICDGQHCSSFVTFSGQQINVAGQMVTVLFDPRGGIILTGDQFVWSNSGLAEGNDHLKIQAKSLNPMAM